MIFIRRSTVVLFFFKLHIWPITLGNKRQVHKYFINEERPSMRLPRIARLEISAFAHLISNQSTKYGLKVRRRYS